MTKWMRLLALVAVLSLVAAACGDDGGRRRRHRRRRRERDVRRPGRGHDHRGRRGRGRGQHHRVGRLHRGRLDRRGLRLGHRRSRRRPAARST